MVFIDDKMNLLWKIAILLNMLIEIFKLWPTTHFTYYVPVIFTSSRKYNLYNDVLQHNMAIFSMLAIASPNLPRHKSTNSHPHKHNIWMCYLPCYFFAMNTFLVYRWFYMWAVRLDRDSPLCISAVQQIAEIQEIL